MQKDSVEFSGIIDGEKVAEKYFSRQRSICANSIFTLVIHDQAATGGIITQADSITLQMFAYDNDTLSIRITESELTFLFLAPIYTSTDKSVTLHRIP